MIESEILNALNKSDISSAVVYFKDTKEKNEKIKQDFKTVFNLHNGSVIALIQPKDFNILSGYEDLNPSVLLKDDEIKRFKRMLMSKIQKDVLSNHEMILGLVRRYPILDIKTGQICSFYNDLTLLWKYLNIEPTLEFAQKIRSRVDLSMNTISLKKSKIIVSFINFFSRRPSSKYIWQDVPIDYLNFFNFKGKVIVHFHTGLTELKENYVLASCHNEDILKWGIEAGGRYFCGDAISKIIAQNRFENCSFHAQCDVEKCFVCSTHLTPHIRNTCLNPLLLKDEGE